MLFQESVEGQPLFAEPRDEAAQGGKAPSTFWTPLRSRIGPIRLRAVTFSGVGLDAPLGNYVSQQQPRGTPKTHFSGFSFTPLARRQSNATRRSLTRSSTFLVFTTISST
jgi:hypothetical protein